MYCLTVSSKLIFSIYSKCYIFYCIQYMYAWTNIPLTVLGNNLGWQTIVRLDKGINYFVCPWMLTTVVNLAVLLYISGDILKQTLNCINYLNHVDFIAHTRPTLHFPSTQNISVKIVICNLTTYWCCELVDLLFSPNVGPRLGTLQGLRG